MTDTWHCEARYIDHHWRHKLIISLYHHIITNWYLICISKTICYITLLSSDRFLRLCVKFSGIISLHYFTTVQIILHWIEIVSNMFSWKDKMVSWNPDSFIWSSFNGLVFCSGCVLLLQKCQYFTVYNSAFQWHWKWKK